MSGGKISQSNFFKRFRYVIIVTSAMIKSPFIMVSGTRDVAASECHALCYEPLENLKQGFPQAHLGR